MIASIATLFSIIFSGILEKVETKQDIDSFRQSSSTLWNLRCRVERLSQGIKAGIYSDDEVCRVLEMIEMTFDETVSNLPTIPNKMVESASYKIKIRKDEEVEMKLL